MKDLAVVHLVDALQAQQFSQVPDADPPTLKITGQGFGSASEVRLNSVPVPFVIVSDRQILAEIPDEVSTLDSVEVLASRLSPGATSAQLVFGLTRNPALLEGLQKLVQQVVVLLLSEQGSNRFWPDSGGSLLSALGETLDANAAGRLSADVSRGVASVQESILQAQSGKALSLEEKLLSLRVAAVTVNPQDNRVTARLQLVNAAARSLTFPIDL